MTGPKTGGRSVVATSKRIKFVMTLSREKGPMNPTIRRVVLAFAAVVLLLGATSARADSYQIGGGGLIAPNSSGFCAMPDGTGFTYDDILSPTSLPLLDNAGLLFTLIATNGSSIFENLYSTGSSFYLESAYLGNGASFPSDYSYVPVTFTFD